MAAIFKMADDENLKKNHNKIKKKNTEPPNFVVI